MLPSRRPAGATNRADREQVWRIDSETQEALRFAWPRGFAEDLSRVVPAGLQFLGEKAVFGLPSQAQTETSLMVTMAHCHGNSSTTNCAVGGAHLCVTGARTGSNGDKKSRSI